MTTQICSPTAIGGTKKFSPSSLTRPADSWLYIPKTKLAAVQLRLRIAGFGMTGESTLRDVPAAKILPAKGEFGQDVIITAATKIRIIGSGSKIEIETNEKAWMDSETLRHWLWCLDFWSPEQISAELKTFRMEFGHWPNMFFKFSRIH